MKRRAAAVVALPLLLGAAGEAPGDAIISYCGGGVTGGGGGTRIEADGAVMRLRRPLAGAPLEETRTGQTAPHERIAALLDAAGFEHMPRGTPANMTFSITRQRGGRSHQVMWPAGQPPAPLRPALREIAAAGR